MATIDMAGEAQPFFHDFLGMAPNGDATKQPQEIAGFRIRNGSRHASAYAQPDLEGETSVKSSSRAIIDICAENSVCSAPARLTGGPSLAFADPSCSSRDSERLAVDKSRGGIQSHGNRSAFRRPENEIKSAGKKRDSPPSTSANTIEQHTIQMTVDRTETTRSPKMAKFEAREERIPNFRQHNGDDFHLAMQPPKPALSCPSLLQPSSSKPDLTVSKRWESPSLYGPSRLGRSGGYDEKISCTPAADNATLPPFAQPAADEGSRTGLQGSGIANLVSNAPWTTNCKSTGAPGLSGSRSKPWSSKSAGSDSVLPPSRQIGASASSQLTIFYGGQAHVFDDVSAEKADAIIGLAGSSGRSWSTTYSSQTRSSLQTSATVPFAGPSTNQRTLRSLQESSG